MVLRASGKDEIAIIQSGKNKSRNKSFSGLNGKVMMYGVDETQFKVSASDQVDYISSHSQVHVKHYPKIFF